jgi:hypothetical protein
MALLFSSPGNVWGWGVPGAAMIFVALPGLNPEKAAPYSWAEA